MTEGFDFIGALSAVAHEATSDPDHIGDRIFVNADSIPNVDLEHLPGELAIEMADTDAAIEKLEGRINDLQDQMWGPDTPEGRELDHIKGTLRAYDARLQALHDDINEAKTPEEYAKAVATAEKEVKQMQDVILKNAQRVSDLSGAPAY